MDKVSSSTRMATTEFCPAMTASRFLDWFIATPGGFALQRHPNRKLDARRLHLRRGSLESAAQAIADTRAPNLLRACSTVSAEGGGKQTASRYD
jgi:hypothetical protein